MPRVGCRRRAGRRLVASEVASRRMRFCARPLVPGIPFRECTIVPVDAEQNKSLLQHEAAAREWSTLHEPIAPSRDCTRRE